MVTVVHMAGYEPDNIHMIWHDGRFDECDICWDKVDDVTNAIEMGKV